MNQHTRVVALEEAFMHPRLWSLLPAPYQAHYSMLEARLSDVGPKRIARMEHAGVDFQVLSQATPGVQALTDTNQAISISREVNDWLGAVVEKHPDRFAGFATLPTQSARAAADELERTVTQWGFKGAMINGHTHGVYLDHPSFSPLLARAEALDVPLYIHPIDPPRAVSDVYYQGFEPALIVAWGWPVETGTHLLRLICSGTFDKHPNLKIIVGHMGELIPYCLPRLKEVLPIGQRMAAAREKQGETSEFAMQKDVGHYLQHNVYFTNSGVFDQATLDYAIAMVGIDRILFSVDDPFADNVAAVDFLRAAEMPAADKHKFSHGNAERLLKLRG